MNTITIETENIQDWGDFHKEFKEKMQFPDWYGMNMDAWIDSTFDLILNIKQDLCIELKNSEDFKNRQPKILKELQLCVSFVNQKLSQMETDISLTIKLS